MSGESQSSIGLTRAEAQALCEKVLAFAQADETRVSVDSGWRGATRMADNRITSGGGYRDVSIRITSSFGQRVASIGTNAVENASLQAAVRESEALARLAPEDPEKMPELGPQSYEQINAFYQSTAQLTQEERARAAVTALDAARTAGFVAAGFIDSRAGTDAVANSRGLFAFHENTGTAYTLTVRAPDGQSSGWAGDEANDWSQIESDRVAADAVRKCSDWRGAAELEPGGYAVILEPTAVGMLMLRLRGALDARSADEGRSYFSKPGGGNRIGEQLFDPRVTIASDPAAPNAETAPYTNDGQPVSKETWIENGVLKTLATSRFWADKQGVEPKPSPSNILMAGGDASLEEMIASTERGVLITRFWYIRPLNARIMSHTGLTRDGTFLIENGKIARPVNNFRFNQSLAELLQNVETIGRPVRVAAMEDSSVGMPIVVPPLKVRDFQLASISDAI